MRMCCEGLYMHERLYIFSIENCNASRVLKFEGVAHYQHCRHLIDI